MTQKLRLQSQPRIACVCRALLGAVKHLSSGIPSSVRSLMLEKSGSASILLAVFTLTNLPIVFVNNFKCAFKTLYKGQDHQFLRIHSSSVSSGYSLNFGLLPSSF